MEEEFNVNVPGFAAMFPAMFSAPAPVILIIPPVFVCVPVPLRLIVPVAVVIVPPFVMFFANVKEPAVVEIAAELPSSVSIDAMLLIVKLDPAVSPHPECSRESMLMTPPRTFRELFRSRIFPENAPDMTV